jgi:pimeloyl-ACP methyl ester carboxylesterase
MCPKMRCYNSRMPTENERNDAEGRPRRVRGAGLDLAATEYGDAARPTVVLVHGFPNTSAIWNPVAGRLSSDFHVVTYDVRGAGASDVPDTRAGYVLTFLVEDLAAVVNATSPDAPVHLVAHDWGSIQGWEAATTDLLAGRIASFTSISGPPLDHAALWARRHRTRETEDILLLLGQAARSWYIALFHLPFLPRLVRQGAPLRRRLSRLTHQSVETPDGPGPAPATMTDDFVQGLELYRANVLPRLRHPVLGHTDTPVQLIVPTHDRYITPSLLDGLETWSPVVWRREVDAGHWIIRTHPDEIADWVRQVIAFVEDGREGPELMHARVSR